MLDQVTRQERFGLLESRVRAQEVVLECVCRAIASFDSRSAQAVALALEVAEFEQAELAGDDDEIVRILRRFRREVEGR
jgi:hypothetical protein